MRTVMNLNHKWAFSKETQDPGQMPRVKYWVNLPHTWNAIDGQDGGGDYERGRFWYMKEIDREDIPKAAKYYLEIRGANSSADVYVGGEHLAHHDGGYATWRVDVTKALQKSTLVAIAVDNSPNEQVYPQMADFTFYGGLYRDVQLICVPESHFDLEYYGGSGLKVTPVMEGDDARVTLEAFLQGACEGQMLRNTILNGEGAIEAQEESVLHGQKCVNEIVLKHAHRWHGRKDPYLYTVVSELMENDTVLDRVEVRFGCRSFSVDPERGFILNGEEYPLRGVCRHQDRWGIGNALLPEHHEEDIGYIMEVGATTIRLAHYQHDQYFYDLCDEKGLVIWAEIPYISRHMPGGRENTIQQMKELVIQNYNHPSIVVWGLSNEITMKGEADEDLLENHRILNDMVHEMDKTRLTTMAVISMCSMHSPYVKIPDVVSWNHYFGWYGGDTSMNGPWLDKFHAELPQIPVGVSEYGCEALNWHTSKPMQGDYTEEYQAYYHEELIKQLFTRKYLWATHVWNMFDFGADNRSEGGENGQNHKGLMTFDRKYKKDAFYAYKAWLSDDPFVHICGKRYVDRVEDVTSVTVYSNQPEVELFVNSESLGKQTAADHFFRFDVPNPGESRLVAVAGECRDESFIRRVEKFNDAYRLKEKGAILNWFDINAPEGYLSLNDRISDILRVPQGAQVLKDLLVRMAPQGAKSGGEINPDMMKMMGGFTVIRLSGMMSTMHAHCTKEELLALNAQLNQIPRA